MIYGFYGFSIELENEIWEKRKSLRESDQGYYLTTQSLINDAKDRGFNVEVEIIPLNCLELVRSKILNLIQNKIPILVCKQWKKNPRLGHFIVIVGINETHVFLMIQKKVKKERLN